MSIFRYARGGHYAQTGWRESARSVVAAFRIDVVRAGAENEIKPLIEQLSAQSNDFAAMWSENGVQSFEGMVKRLHHPELGEIDLEYSSLAIDERPDLAMAIYSSILPAYRRDLQLFIQSRQDERD